MCIVISWNFKARAEGKVSAVDFNRTTVLTGRFGITLVCNVNY